MIALYHSCQGHTVLLYVSYHTTVYTVHCTGINIYYIDFVKMYW